MSAIDPVTEHDCLVEPGNLEEVPDERPDVTVRRCTVCGRRHIEVTVDPLEMRIEPR